ncbi:uncharacterized protein LOC143180912 [Calliopsis andreniformis]|uniref:uncharacterized protein LOC143180912 n=1 Tax=Calliopsis andreniformis TaxID=337506 RepID=UPI003FCE8223
MIESDQSDKELQDQATVLKISNDSVCNESMQKRLREESSEDENPQLPLKKLCTSKDEIASKECDGKKILDVNGTTTDTNKDAKGIKVSDNKENIKSMFVLKDGTNRDVHEKNDASCNENEDEGIISDTTETEEKKNQKIIDEEHKGSISAEHITDVDTKEISMNEKEEEDDIKRKKVDDKSKIEDAEVVEGLELTVECASDKESSSVSEKEEDEDRKSKPKTVIVKAKPNDSELDVSSSETEISDTQDVSKVKTKQSIKKGKRTKITYSEENYNVSDEEYSPRTKRKLKKPLNKKATKSPSESGKRGRIEKEVSRSIEEEDEDMNGGGEVTSDKKLEENLSNTESLQSGSESDNDENVSKDEGRKKRRRNNRPEDDKRIQVLKKYIRAAGIHIKSYNNLWAGCKSNNARVICLKEILEKNGVSGRPTLEKCKKAKEKNETLKDVAELNTSNIISEGRVTRAQRHKGSSNKESTKTPGTFKRILSVVDSDSD